MIFFHHCFDFRLKFGINVIISKFLLNIVHRMSQQAECLFNIPVIVCLPTIH